MSNTEQTVTASDDYPLTYGQAMDAAIAGHAVIAHVWQTRYVYEREASSLLCIHDERPAHDQIAGNA